MSKWSETSKGMAEQREHSSQATKRYRTKYPDRKLDYEIAQAEYCVEILGLREDCLKVSGVMTKKLRHELLTQALLCPECNQPMEYEELPGCLKANPQRYTCVFLCSGENCTYHFFTRQGLIDVARMAKMGQGNLIEKITGIVDS